MEPKWAGNAMLTKTWAFEQYTLLLHYYYWFYIQKRVVWVAVVLSAQMLMKRNSAISPWLFPPAERSASCLASDVVSCYINIGLIQYSYFCTDGALLLDCKTLLLVILRPSSNVLLILYSRLKCATMLQVKLVDIDYIGGQWTRRGATRFWIPYRQAGGTFYRVLELTVF